METSSNGDPKCIHKHIDIVAGGGDAEGFWDTFMCRECGWSFDLRTDGKDEF